MNQETVSDNAEDLKWVHRRANSNTPFVLLSLMQLREWTTLQSIKNVNFFSEDVGMVLGLLTQWNSYICIIAAPFRWLSLPWSSGEINSVRYLRGSGESFLFLVCLVTSLAWRESSLMTYLGRNSFFTVINPCYSGSQVLLKRKYCSNWTLRGPRVILTSLRYFNLCTQRIKIRLI